MGAIGLALGGVSLVLALEYKPRWYRPFRPGESHLQLARMEALRVVDSISDRLVEGEPFEVVLTDDQLNIWLAGLDQIWPEAARRIPPEIVAPFVKFEPSLLRIAARVDSRGWRAIVTTRYTFEISADKKTFIVGLASATCGCVRVPQSLITAAITSPIRVNGESYGIHDLYEGLKLENRFTWPNGRRQFRFEEITVGSGSVRVRIEPLW